MNTQNKTKILLVYSVYITTLSLCFYITAYSPIYFEGDDASTILFHLFGRNPELQSAFASYHSGFDYLLSFLPIEESILRNFSFFISYCSGFILIYILGFWLIRFNSFGTNAEIVMAFILPFLIPELIFQALILNPTNIGFVFCLIALLAVEYYFEYKKIIFLFFLPLLFLIGVPFRWSLILFLSVLFGYVYFERSALHSLLKLKKRDLFVIGFLFLSLIFSFLGIFITGYTPYQVWETMAWGASYSESSQLSYLALCSKGLSLFTPLFATSLIIGIIHVLLTRKLGTLLFFILSLLPFTILGIDTSLKYLITALPSILLVSLLGFNQLFLMRRMRPVMIILFIIPWLVGVQISLVGTDFGPKFEIRQPKWSGEKASQFVDAGLVQNPDKRILKKNFSLGLDGGLAMPTIEGMRSFWGYGNVLLFGNWRKFHLRIKTERLEILNLANTNKNLFILQKNGHDILECILFENGYRPLSEIYRKMKIKIRTYSKGKSVIRVGAIKGYNTDLNNCVFLNNLAPDIIYMSSITEVKKVLPCQNFIRIGPFTLQNIDSLKSNGN